MIYWIAHGIFTVISKIFFPVRLSGIKNIPPKDGFIIASNHLSNLDPMLLGIASGRRLSYVAKESLFTTKIVKFFLHQVGAFPIRRETGDVSAIKEALKRLKQGGGLVIFPEGTRKALRTDKKVQPGIGLLAVKSGAAIIPAFISDSDKVLPPGEKSIKPGKIHISFGKAVIYSSNEPYLKVAEAIMQSIDSLSAQLPSSNI